MSILVALQHITRYQYDRPVGLGPQIVRLRPAPHSRTAIKSYSLTVSPSPHFVTWQQDPNHGSPDPMGGREGDHAREELSKCQLALTKL